jgi:hypothetical protein
MMKFLNFVIGIIFIKTQIYSVIQQNISLIDPLTTYVESRACNYSFKVGCGNQSISFDYLNNNLTNGNSAVDKSWPWVVSIWVIYNNLTAQYCCSGYILSNRHILTNAKILDSLNNNQLRVVVGSNLLLETTTLSDSNYAFSVLKKSVHPKFNASNADLVSYNLALLTLSSRITFSDKISPICLPISASYFSRILNNSVFSVTWLIFLIPNFILS